jgi:hypothetical protein
MRLGEFLDGVVAHTRAALPPERAAVQVRRQTHLVKLWYQEPRLHYEVWPVGGRDLIEAGLHFEAAAEVNARLLRWFDPHIVALKATLDGAIDLEQWTPSWGHLYHVFPAPALTPALQREVADWLVRLIVVAEPLLEMALTEIGPVTAPLRQPRDWAAWRARRAKRAAVGG